MNRNLVRILIGGAALLLLLYAFFSRPSEADQIRNLLLEVKKMAEVKGASQHPIEQAGTAKKLASYAADTLHVQSLSEEFDPIVVKGRENLKQKILAGRSKLSKLEIELNSISISLKDDTALAAFELSVLGALTGEEGDFLEMHEVKLELIKEDSRWKLHRAIHIRNLRDN